MKMIVPESVFQFCSITWKHFLASLYIFFYGFRVEYSVGQNIKKDFQRNRFTHRYKRFIDSNLSTYIIFILVRYYEKLRKLSLANSKSSINKIFPFPSSKFISDHSKIASPQIRSRGFHDYGGKLSFENSTTCHSEYTEQPK